MRKVSSSAMSAPSAARKRLTAELSRTTAWSSATGMVTRPSDMSSEDETPAQALCQAPARVSSWRLWGVRLLRTVTAALVVGAVVLFVRRLDFAALRHALARAALVPIALA